MPAEDFSSTVELFKSRFTANYPEEWGQDLASFKDEPEEGLPLGIQLVIQGGNSDRLFRRWRDLLRSDLDLLARCNAFKSAHALEGYDDYTAAKAEFIEPELGDSLD